MYNNQDILERSFDLSYISAHLIQAQWAEFVELKKRINEVFEQQKRPIMILDIGVGNGRVPMYLCGVKEMWDMIARYDGTDNAQGCVELANANFQQYGIHQKASAILFDAQHLHQWKSHYDMVVITWFTAGNFYPEHFDFKNYMHQEDRLNLTTNQEFTSIFKSAYALLNPGGQILIGACYIDNESTRLKQEESYKKMGMDIITTAADSFTATRQGFWSQRFTKEKLRAYLPFVPETKIGFIPLDTYDYAMQVIIRK